jgi:putative phage-type endonuclease
MPTEILKADQYLTEDWHQLRRNAVSASEIAAVMGISPWSSPFALYHAKRDDWRAPVTEAMEMGHRLEPVVADLLDERLAKTTNDYFEMRKTGTWRADSPDWALATPDRLLFWSPNDGNDHTENVELKSTTVYDDWGPDESDEIPVHYRAQVQWQMYCTGLQRTHVGVLFKGNHFRHYVVDRDETDIQSMLAAADLFMQRLRDDNPPPVDGSEATLDMLKRLHPDLVDEDVTLPQHLIREWREASNDLAAAKARRELLANEIRAAMGAAARGIDGATGEVVVARQVFDRKGYTVEPCVIDQLRSA